ncbi:hypothetical protein [Sulfuriferula sp. AH1]|uniref:plasmid mobilization protein n=1 Tax=Sulfuriferula sp. AH1 TaxID=1985873 RepID=UPI001CB8A608|nr:hypothetical protein [Sulfuriferula sp. AH1]
MATDPRPPGRGFVTSSTSRPAASQPVINRPAPCHRGGHETGAATMPRKPKEPTRTVSFRLTLPDHAAYLAKANAAGVKPSEFFRDAVLTNRTQVVARAQPSSDKRRLIYLFNKASNNLNQLAHTANAAELAGTVTPATYAGILAELQTLADVMKKAIRDAD